MQVSGLSQTGRPLVEVLPCYYCVMAHGCELTKAIHLFVPALCPQYLGCYSNKYGAANAVSAAKAKHESKGSTCTCDTQTQQL